MRRIFRVVVALGVVVACLATASPAPAAARVVADVRISWADAGHRAVRVEWREAPAAPNHVQVLYGAGTSGIPEVYLDRDAPNSVLIRTDRFAVDQVARIAVAVGTPGGTDTGTAYSATFDTQTLPQPRVTSIAPGAGSTMTWSWPAVRPRTDPNPGDPLDLPATVRYQPLASGGPAMVPAAAVTTATRASRRDHGGTYRLGVAAVNEWSPVADGYEALYRAADVAASTAAVRAPAVATYGSNVIVYGQVRLRLYGCRPGRPCGSVDAGAAVGRPVRIEARPNSTSRWLLARSTRTDSHGIYRGVFGTPGSRQYRVVVPNLDPGAGYYRGTVGGPVTTVALTRILSARFLDPTVGYGRPAVAFLAVAPGSATRAVLQRRGADGVYRGIGYVRLSSGRGAFRITATPRGSSYYRYVVPASSHNGHHLAGVISRPFPLAVR